MHSLTETRTIVAAVAASSTTVVTFASSIYATAIPALIRHFGDSQEVLTLGVTLYVLGFALGPVIFAPASELKGRRLPFLISLVGFTIFSIGAAVSKSVASLLVCRFFAGVFGAGPLVLAPAVFSDIFEGKSLGVSMLVFSFVVFAGPAIAQPIGGFIVMNESLGWRWTQYICGILGGVCLLANTLGLRETHRPVSKSVEDKSPNSTSSRGQPVNSWFNLLLDNFGLPIKMLCTEPIVLLVCLFGSYMYALLYLFLSAYPTVFQRTHHMNPGVGGLPYLALMIGQLLGCFAIFISQGISMARAKGQPRPEEQLVVASPAAFAFGIGLIWFGWTGYKSSIHWIAPTLSGLLSGFGMVASFVPSITYLVRIRPQW